MDVRGTIEIIAGIVVATAALVEAINALIERSSLVANNIRGLFKHGLKKIQQ